MKTNEDILLLPFKFFWIIAFFPKPIQLILFFIYIVILINRFKFKIKINKFIFFQFVYLSIFFVSIIYNSIINTHETNRIFAACNTFLINFFALIGYCIFENFNLVNSSKLAKYSLNNLLILILFNIIYLSPLEIKNFVIFNHCLYAADSVNGAYTTRFYGFLDYSNMVVFTVLFFYPFALAKIKNCSLYKILLTFSLLFVIYTTNSRSGLVLFLIVTFSFLIFGIKEKVYKYILRKRQLFFLIGFLMVLVLLLFGNSYLHAYIYKLLNMRVDSNSMRSYIYKSSISRMMHENPLFGIGIKDMLGSYGYPYGSHSTYIGVFYKTGICGGIVYMISILILLFNMKNFKSITNIHFFVKFSIICTFILMTMEDIDGTNWAIILMFILISQISKTINNRRIVS